MAAPPCSIQPRGFRAAAHAAPTAVGRVYAAYGGVYITVALAWLWAVDGIRPSSADILGVALSLAGMGVIMFGSR